MLGRAESTLLGMTPGGGTQKCTRINTSGYVAPEGTKIEWTMGTTYLTEWSKEQIRAPQIGGSSPGGTFVRTVVGDAHKCSTHMCICTSGEYPEVLINTSG